MGYLLVFIILCVLQATGSAQPWPYLNLIESVDWDSNFVTKFSPEQEKEIQNICNRMRPNRRDTVIYSANGMYKMTYKAYSLYEKDDLTVEATYYDSAGNKLWDETLSFIPEISPTGEWMYGSDNMGCGMIIFYRAVPMLEAVKVVYDCFDQKKISSDGEFIAAVRSPAIGSEISDLIVVFSADGTELWRRRVRHGNKMVAVSEDSRYIVAASNLCEGEWKDYYTKLYFFRKDGQEIGRFVVGPDQLWMRPVLRQLLISPDGKLTLAVFDAAIMAFETESGEKLWTYFYPDAYWWISEVVFIPGGDLIAISVVHAVPRKHRRYINLLDAQGRMHNNMLLEIEEESLNQRQGLRLRGTSGGEFLIAAGAEKRHLIQLIKRH